MLRNPTDHSGEISQYAVPSKSTERERERDNELEVGREEAERVGRVDRGRQNNLKTVKKRGKGECQKERGDINRKC